MIDQNDKKLLSQLSSETKSFLFIALSMRKCWIETRTISLTAKDAINCKEYHLIRDLGPDQDLVIAKINLLQQHL